MTYTHTVNPENRMLIVDPKERFSLSPYLFMQFMEPLGTTDGSTEAGWDFQRECWRQDLVNIVKELAPTLIRLGGCFSSYYRWKEAVGPRNKRKAMLNLCWGGIESNQVGTHEFIDFCHLIGSDPLITVNFESDGRKHWAKTLKGDVRSAGPEEAAEWVDYCNNPSNRERKKNGANEPFNVHLWQIGNETSYDPNGYDCEIATKRTLAFAKAMREVDPYIELIGWGDSGWAHRMCKVAGEELQYIAFHHHFGLGLDNSLLCGTKYHKDPARTWELLMNAYKSTEKRIEEMRAEVADCGIKLALTESHFALPSQNRGKVLSMWAAGVANARILNVHEKNGDILKIATLADFFGTRWMVNAIIIPASLGRLRIYMMPVARVMALYREHIGKRAIEVVAAPGDLDITASRTEDYIYLHVVNINRDRSIPAQLQVDRMKILSGNVFEMAVDPELEVDEYSCDVLRPVMHTLPTNGSWTFPTASVSAVKLKVAKALK